MWVNKYKKVALLASSSRVGLCIIKSAAQYNVTNSEADDKLN